MFKIKTVNIIVCDRTQWQELSVAHFRSHKSASKLKLKWGLSIAKWSKEYKDMPIGKWYIVHYIVTKRTYPIK